jgi:DNA-binding CsgD family transcriptional regulator|nr:helix-turn-helix transcriptional regulator [Phocaeicola plebeius]
MSTHEISECLFISENTVEWHRKNLMVKFGAKNATDLVIKALSKGYLSIPLK